MIEPHIARALYCFLQKQAIQEIVVWHWMMDYAARGPEQRDLLEAVLDRAETGTPTA